VINGCVKFVAFLVFRNLQAASDKVWGLKGKGIHADIDEMVPQVVVTSFESVFRKNSADLLRSFDHSAEGDGNFDMVKAHFVFSAMKTLAIRIKARLIPLGKVAASPAFNMVVVS